MLEGNKFYLHLPHAPGVYKYLDAKGEIIYVGKAKDLKKRVASYFQKSQNNPKTRSLVKSVARIEFVLVNTEHDAFLLENNLIKEYQPKYNINLKDDKRFPYVLITNEPYPRVFLSRRVNLKQGEYLGPYTSIKSIRELLQSLIYTLGIRTCRLALTPKNIENSKFKPCLEYHLGYCKAPCIGLQSRAEYLQKVELLRATLKGKNSELIKTLKQEMQAAAELWEFEKAHAKKVQINLLREICLPSEVESATVGDLDVIAVDLDENHGYAIYMLVRAGRIIHTQFSSFNIHLEIDLADILSQLIVQFRDKLKSQITEILVPYLPSIVTKDLNIILPTSPEQKGFLNFAMHNILNYKEQIQNSLSTISEDKLWVLEQLQKILHLPNLPRHIECFDNSHFQGSYLGSAVVVFRDGLPSTREYRTFRLREVEGIDDFKSMREAVFRRYKRLGSQQKSLPDLLLIDGGKGQLNMALSALRQLGLEQKISLVALAKREEQLFLPGQADPLILPMNSEALLLIRRVRDESHRFVLQFHRKMRSRGMLQTELRKISGIGKKSSELLLRVFSSVEKIKTVPIDILASVIGMHKARQVWEFFQKQKINKN